jgi:hypothetical protein
MGSAGIQFLHTNQTANRPLDPGQKHAGMTKARCTLGNVGRSAKASEACPTSRLNVGHAALCPTYATTYVTTYAPLPSSRHGVSRDPVPARKQNSKQTLPLEYQSMLIAASG